MQSSQDSEQSPEARPVIGKIILKTQKSTLIGKIVPRASKEGQDAKESPVKHKETPKVVEHDKKVTLSAKAKPADKEASGVQTRRVVDLISKTRESACSEGAQNQTATTSSGSIKHQEDVASALRTAKHAEQTQTVVKEEGEVSENLDTDQSKTKRSAKSTSGFRVGQSGRTSRAVALSFKTLNKRQRRKMVKSLGSSPEAAAEAGALRGEEAAMPQDCKAAETPGKIAHRRYQRRSVFGYRRKPATGISVIGCPRRGRARKKHVFYTYVPEALPPTAGQDGNKLQIQGENMTPSEEEPRSVSEHVLQSSSNSSTTVTSGRSSRVIKTPKRFLDEEMIPFPKGSLSMWLKSQQREDGKPGASLHESHYDRNSQPSGGDSVFDSQSGLSKASSPSISGVSHVEIYKNLKRLTLKLAEKKKGQSYVQKDYADHGDSLASHVRRKRKPKLMMEELDTPGVVRKLAVVVNTDFESPSQIPEEDSGKNSKQ